MFSSIIDPPESENDNKNFYEVKKLFDFNLNQPTEVQLGASRLAFCSTVIEQQKKTDVTT